MCYGPEMIAKALRNCWQDSGPRRCTLSPAAPGRMATARDHIIHEACHNTYLAEQARQLHTRLKPYRRLQLRARHRVSNSLTEHQKIVEAILAGDSAKAEQRLREHILIQGQRLN